MLFVFNGLTLNPGYYWFSILTSEACLSLDVNLDTSDFSVGVDNYYGTRLHTFTGAHDGVSDGIISKDDCLMMASDATLLNHHIGIQKINNGMASQVNFKVTYSFYVPAGQNHVDGMQLHFYTGGSTVLAIHQEISGAWTTNTIYFSAPETALMYLIFYAMDGASITYSGDNDGIGDLLYLKDIVISYVLNEFSLKIYRGGVFQGKFIKVMNGSGIYREDQNLKFTINGSWIGSVSENRTFEHNVYTETTLKDTT